jgi:Holliday junction resolvase RusA-like endonuclease
MIDAPTIVLHLPIPPSANRIWRTIPGMRKPTLSEEYRAWINTAGWTAKQQLVGIPMILGAFSAQVEIPEKSRRDRDNWTKPLFDLCQRIGAVRNDRGLGVYTVTPTDRTDCMVALWDLGGVPLPEPKRKTHAVSTPRKRFTPRDRKAAAIYAKAFL